MKFALCMFGQLRHPEKTIADIKKNLLNINDLDVFIHSWYDPDNLYMEKTHIGRDSCFIKQGTDEYIIQNYKPKKSLFEKPKTFSNKNIDIPDKYLTAIFEMNKGKLKNKEETKKHCIKNTYSMFYSIFKSNLLKEQYALENDITYDGVINLRFDAKLGRPIFLSHYKMDYIHYQTTGIKDSIMCDWINFGSNDIMNIYNSVFLHLEYLNKLDKFYPAEKRTKNTLFPSETHTWGNEHMFRDILDLFNIPRKSVLLNVTLQY